MDKEIAIKTDGYIRNGDESGTTLVWKPKEPVPMNFVSADIVFAIAMLFCGFLYCNLIRFVSLGAGVTIFAAIFCSITAVYFKYSGIKQTRESWLCLGIIAISGANFFIFDDTFTKELNFMFLSACVVYWICLSTGRRLDNKLSIYIVGDIINQFLAVPFSNFTCCFAGIKKSAKNGKRGKGVLASLLGIVIFLPVLILVIKLLTDADAAFEGFMSHIQFSLSGSAIEYILEIIFGVPVACYLFGLIYGNKYQRHTDNITLESLEKNAGSLRFAPRITVNSALTALNAVYLVFFISQTAYLFSAFGNILPKTMTYAEYARRGFFELCTVAGINLGVIVCAYLITNRNVGETEKKNSDLKQPATKALRIETAVLCVFTMMLIATALSKMAIYINCYGLTQLRVYATWFMIFLLLVFTIVAIRQFKNFNGSKIVIISFVLLFMVLCYGNVDGMIAKYNIDQYREGTLENIDVEALKNLSYAATPYVFELYKETDDTELKAKLRSAITGVYEDGVERDAFEKTFRNFNLQSYKADRIKASFWSNDSAANL